MDKFSVDSEDNFPDFGSARSMDIIFHSVRFLVSIFYYISGLRARTRYGSNRYSDLIMWQKFVFNVWPFWGIFCKDLCTYPQTHEYLMLDEAVFRLKLCLPAELGNSSNVHSMWRYKFRSFNRIWHKTYIITNLALETHFTDCDRT